MSEPRKPPSETPDPSPPEPASPATEPQDPPQSDPAEANRRRDESAGQTREPGYDQA